jgi:hypothetical protein
VDPAAEKAAYNESEISLMEAVARYKAEATDHGGPRWRRQHNESEVSLKEAVARYKAEATDYGGHRWRRQHNESEVSLKEAVARYIKRRPPTTVNPAMEKAAK